MNDQSFDPADKAPSSTDDAVAFDQYLAGELPSAEARRFREAMASRPEYGRFVGLIERWLAGPGVPDAPSQGDAFDRLRRTLQERETPPRRVTLPTLRLPTLRRGAVVCMGAAVVVLAIVGTFLTRPDRTDNAEPSLRYATAPGQRSIVHLADGSTMILAPATAVTVSPDQIDVTGEIYFTIVPRASRPKTVRTPSAVVQVLGTTFGVREYANERRARVVVEDGRVSIRDRHGDRNSSHVLSSRMMALVTDSGVTVTAGIATREYIGWTQGTLVFNGIPLRDVVAELNRAYGTEIHIADSTLAEQKIIAEVEVGKKPLTQILDAISFIVNAHYERNGGAFVLLKGRGRELPSGQIPRTPLPQPEKQYGR